MSARKPIMRATAGTQDADDAGAGDAAMHLEPVAFELASNDVGGPLLVESQFGVGVDIAAQSRQLGQERQVRKRNGRGMIVSLLAPIMPRVACSALAFIMLRPMQLVLISGLSGSGKSVALHLLEDAGYYCVDNLPVIMLTVLVRMLREEGITQGGGGDRCPLGRRHRSACRDKLRLLEEDGTRQNFLFLHANDETLLKRYSESRRRHPLASDGQSLAEAIRTERELLEPISTLGHRIDTSDLKANALREWVRQFIEAEPGRGLTLMFESFGFKHGIPLDADLVFDVRCLPNPHYDSELRPLTGKDRRSSISSKPKPRCIHMRDDICRFVATWLPALHPRQPQLPDRGDRLHGRPAPLGVYRRMARSRIPGPGAGTVRHRSLAML